MANELYEKEVVLLASAARAANENGDAVYGYAWARHWVIELNVTAAGTLVGDTLDVYIDFSLDGSAWYNAAHFTQVLGNGGAKRELAVLDTTNPGTSVIDATADASAGDQRPAVVGSIIRARTVNVDGGGTHSFTFSVLAVAQ